MLMDKGIQGWSPESKWWKETTNSLKFFFRFHMCPGVQTYVRKTTHIHTDNKNAIVFGFLIGNQNTVLAFTLKNLHML